MKEHYLDKQLRHFSLGETIRLQERAGVVDLTGRTSFAIDCWNTWRREDAIAFEKQDGGYRLWISVLDVGPFLHFSPALQMLSLNPLAKTNTFYQGANKALTVELWTNFSSVENPSIYRSAIHCEPYVHRLSASERLFLEMQADERHCAIEDLLASPEVPRTVEQGLKHATGANSTIAAVQRSMLLLNRLVGSHLANLELSAPYTVVQRDGSLRYAASPSETARTPFTNPVRRRLDQFTQWQLWNRLTRSKQYIRRPQMQALIEKENCYAA